MSAGSYRARVGKVFYSTDGVRFALCMVKGFGHPVSVVLPGPDAPEAGDTVLLRLEGSEWKLAA